MRGFGGRLHSSNIHVMNGSIDIFGPRFTCRWLPLEGYKYKVRESCREVDATNPIVFFPSPSLPPSPLYIGYH
jgi:hypothetical protein